MIWYPILQEQELERCQNVSLNETAITINTSGLKRDIMIQSISALQASTLPYVVYIISVSFIYITICSCYRFISLSMIFWFKFELLVLNI